MLERPRLGSEVGGYACVPFAPPFLLRPQKIRLLPFKKERKILRGLTKLSSRLQISLLGAMLGRGGTDLLLQL